MISTPDRTLNDAQSAFVGRNIVRVVQIGQGLSKVKVKVVQQLVERPVSVLCL